MDTRTLLPAASLGAAVAACFPDAVLDRRAVLEGHTWWDNRDFHRYEAKIPFFESPDRDIDATYAIRWEVVTKHLTYGSPETGYTFTECTDRPFWSGAYDAISCPLGHQHHEVRWLKDRRIIGDFARYLFETPGAQPRSYSNWYGDAMWATDLVLGHPWKGILQEPFQMVGLAVEGAGQLPARGRKGAWGGGSLRQGLVELRLRDRLGSDWIVAGGLIESELGPRRSASRSQGGGPRGRPRWTRMERTGAEGFPGGAIRGDSSSP
jgi:hypothetical protein